MRPVNLLMSRVAIASVSTVQTFAQCHCESTNIEASTTGVSNRLNRNDSAMPQETKKTYFSPHLQPDHHIRLEHLTLLADLEERS